MFLLICCFEQAKLQDLGLATAGISIYVAAELSNVNDLVRYRQTEVSTPYFRTPVLVRETDKKDIKALPFC